jgi:hypothetical protein
MRSEAWLTGRMNCRFADCFHEDAEFIAWQSFAFHRPNW